MTIEVVAPQRVVRSTIISITRSAGKGPLFLFAVSPTISAPLWESWEELIVVGSEREVTDG